VRARFDFAFNVDTRADTKADTRAIDTRAIETEDFFELLFILKEKTRKMDNGYIQSGGEA